MAPTIALAAALGLLVLALAFAWWVDKRHEALARWLAHPLTYALALGAYFTGWAYFGTGTAVVESGIAYLSHEIGWSFLFLFAWPLVLRAFRFARAHRVTTLPGFLTVRYGGSGALSALLVAVLVLAMLPYVTLQLQAIAFALETVATAHAPAPGELQTLVPLWAALVAAFAILFGGRQSDPTRRLPGVFATVAASGALKLGAIVAVAVAAWWHFRAQWPPLELPQAPLGSSSGTSYMVWLVNLGASMASVLLFPHMFQLAVVEARDERQIRTSRWAFPLYGWIFEVAVIPVTIAGVALGLRGPALQGAVLLVPDSGPLRLVAFLGGVSAASGMAVITLIALANTVLLDGLLPLVGSRVSRLGPALVPLRAGIIAALAVAATALWRFVETRFLYEVGLVAFVAVSQLAPAFFGGLVWPQLSRRAVSWGLGLAAILWLYTAFGPAIAPAAPVLADWVARGPFGWAFLKPQALLGLSGLPPAIHAFLCCSLANGAAMWAVMALRPPHAAEVRRARLVLGGAAAPATGRPTSTRVDWDQLAQLVAAMLGPDAATAEIERIRAAFDAHPAGTESGVLATRDALESVLRGPLGAHAARDVVDQLLPLSAQSMGEVMQAYRQLEQLLALSQDELAARIQELTRLKDELEERVEARTQDLSRERDRLQAAVEELRKLEQLKAAFVNAISHDLRIPLTGIMGYAEFLEDGIGGPLSETQADHVGHILDAARRMTRLLNELLDYARLEAGTFTVESRPMAFEGALEQAAATFYPAFERKRLRYTAELPEALPEVTADPERIVQVLSNLLSNAAKFTPEGGAVTVRARLTPDGRMVRVEVADTGVGIPQADLPHLFERFYQTAAGHQAGGTGLGLNISKTLIEAQGGQMGVESVPGRGSTFWFTLPVAEPEGDEI